MPAWQYSPLNNKQSKNKTFFSFQTKNFFDVNIQNEQHKKANTGG